MLRCSGQLPLQRVGVAVHQRIDEAIALTMTGVTLPALVERRHVASATTVGRNRNTNS
jgi:hypothetical protein